MAEHPPYLLLLTKVFAPSHISDGTQRIADGPIQGLGIFIDNNKPGWDLRTNTRVAGFSAPFANIQLALVDLHDFHVVSQKATQAATAYPGRIVLEDVVLESVINKALGDLLPEVLQAGH